jgi:hypothetical protein
VFDATDTPMRGTAHPVSRIVVVMENDQKSKQAALRLCEKHPDDTLCIEWNPENHHWRAAAIPGGQTLDPCSLQVDKRAKLVLVGHYRADQTIAAQTPESLAAAQVRLLSDLGITAPRKISLTGVCYTAPEASALDAAADSLAGRFALTLHQHGIVTPVTAIDGEVFVNPDGAKVTVSPNGVAALPAREHKLTLSVSQDGVLSSIPATCGLHEPPIKRPAGGIRRPTSDRHAQTRAPSPDSLPCLSVSGPASRISQAQAAADPYAAMSMRLGLISAWSKI